MEPNPLPDLMGRRVVVPGGTGAVGEGVVRRYLAAGADVVVPTRSERRSSEFRALLGTAEAERLHVVVHDYTTFAGAEDLMDQTAHHLGGVDDVVAPIGGWWAGGPLSAITEQDWGDAFVGLASTHIAVLRAALPRMNRTGAYSVVVGDSASFPVPGSGLVSMEQAAVLMMQRVAAVESGDSRRIFALTLGPVRTRDVEGDPTWISSDQVGAAAVALSASTAQSDIVPLHGADEVTDLLRTIRAAERS
ncbi:SDR family oxidoreductase [Amnibacterium setariae]|nr:SDR family oxidoreductase [Amnibacterium setariae]